ncbi:MAG TPA: hypothetical protein VNU46_07030 [Gemmatimonadaceae bacterium]|jgi:hypothetical protein|nr:hypothetical protein [Gemmatimonadaceae bacterium]
MSELLPSRLSRGSRIAQSVAIAGALLALGALLWSSARTWHFTTGAPVGWRLRLLVPDILWLSACLLGCATAAWSPSPWRRRLGWSVVLGTLLVVLLLTAAAVLS